MIRRLSISAWGRGTLDLGLVLLSWLLAFWLRFNLDIPDEFVALALQGSVWVVLAYGISLQWMQLYRYVWRYTSLHELRQLGLGVLLGAVLSAAAVLMQRYPSFPRSVLVIHPLVALMLLGAVRAGWRLLAESVQKPTQERSLLVVGTLKESAGVLTALKAAAHWHVAGVLSPADEDQGMSIQNVAVLGIPVQMVDVARKTGASAVLVAGLGSTAQRRDALLAATEAGLSVLTLPRPDEWFQTAAPGPRPLVLDDLLGRESVDLDVAGLSHLLAGQAVLVTGAGGSIGSELCRQLARLGVARLVCVDISEFAIYQLEQSLRSAHPQLQAVYYTANVREMDRFEAIAMICRPVVVMHAAAYKHVPLMEQHNEIEALRTNVLGTLNVARVAGQCGASRFVLVSTDKAVNPTNMMGASKRLAELVVQALAPEFPATRYLSVRFGNVLGSSGSVVPLFTRQIEKGGPVTVTHPDIVRYFMTIPEAAQLVLQAGLMGQSGQIFVLDMGEPVKIVDLARLMIRLSGRTEQEVPLAFTGLRPGEKLFEELLADDESTEPTPHPKLRVAKTVSQGARLVTGDVQLWLSDAGAMPDPVILRAWVQQWVPEYRSRVVFR